MSTSGPELPPHLLAKRKRQAEDDAARVSSNAISNSRDSHPSSSDGAEKRRRAIGPVLPPAILGEQPTDAPNSSGEDSSSDDEIGPSLPTASEHTAQAGAEQRMARLEAIAREEAKKPKREEWMLVPPKDEDWSSRVDPTKLRNRKFNTGKGAKAPAQNSGGVSSIWTETPEEKRQRLADEVMGVRKPATGEQQPVGQTPKDEDTARRIREYNDKNRNKSLYEEHKKTTPREKEDDPSKRAFDREKDIGGGGRRIGYTQKKEMLTRAADFGSRFSSGSFL